MLRGYVQMHFKDHKGRLAADKPFVVAGSFYVYSSKISQPLLRKLVREKTIFLFRSKVPQFHFCTLLRPAGVMLVLALCGQRTESRRPG